MMATRVKRCILASGQDDHQAIVRQMKDLQMEMSAETRMVKLRQNSDNSSKLGFSLRGGKEATGSSVGVFVSHVESCGEAHKKGLKLGDQLVRVNGLDVNRATYDEVIGIIKRTPECGDILLEVRGGNLIPFQEKSGQPIKWLQVSLPAPLEQQQHQDVCSSSSSSSSSSSVSISASDEGVDSCESNEVLLSPHRNHWTTGKDDNSKDEQVTGSLSSVDGGCCSISISSLASSANDATCMQDSKDQQDEEEPELERIRVPGGQATAGESFGCGVVKGPDEWPGIFVQNVKPGSLAERVGLEAGDQLLEADGSQLNEVAFESAIKLIKKLQLQQTELVLLVRKGAALRHLARQSTSSSLSSAAWSATAMTTTTTQSRTEASKQEQAKSRTSGASPPIKPRVSLKLTASESNSDNDEDDYAAADDDDDCDDGDGEAAAWGNPISGTQNQPTKRTMNAAKDNNNNNNTANADANATTQLAGANHLSSSSSSLSIWAGSEKLERELQEEPLAAAASRVVNQATRKMPQASSGSKLNCQGCNRGHEEREKQKRVAAASNRNRAALANPPNRESDQQQHDEDENVEERIRIVSQNCKLHHQRRNTKHTSTSVVIREKFPQLASSHHPTSEQQQLESSHRMAANSNNNRNVLKSKYHHLSSQQQQQQQQQQQLRAGPNSGMKRYVSMDNLCSNSRLFVCGNSTQQQLRLLDQRQQQHRAARIYSQYARPTTQLIGGGSMSAEQRFARIQQYRRRSNSVLGQYQHQQQANQHPCSLADCCHINQNNSKAHQISATTGEAAFLGLLQPSGFSSSGSTSQSADCCKQWPLAYYASQTLASSQLQLAAANCLLSRRRLNYRAQSVDKLNLLVPPPPHPPSTPSQMKNNAYLRRYVGHTTVVGPKSATKQRRTQLQPQLHNQLQANQHVAQQQQAGCCSATNIYNNYAAARMISPLIDSTLQAGCCSQKSRSSSNSQRLMTTKTSSSHLNLRKESIYLSCCSPPAQTDATSCCCCSSSASSLSANYHSVKRSHGLAGPNNSSSHSTGDSSGYLSSGSFCGHAVPLPPPSSVLSSSRIQQRQRNSRPTKQRTSAAPLPPPPPVITMEFSQQQQQRDTRIQCLSTFVSGQQQQRQRQPNQSPNRQLMITSSAGSDFSSFSPNPDSSLSSSLSIADPITSSAGGSDSSLLSSDQLGHRKTDELPTKRQNFSSSSSQQQHVVVVAAPSSSNRLSPPRPPPLPLPDPEFECRINTLKQSSLSTSGSKRQTQTQVVAAAVADSSESESAASKQQLDRLCFVDELKMLAQRGQQQSPDSSHAGTSATLFKTLKASKAANTKSRQQQQPSSCACCISGAGKPRNCSTTTGACRLHDHQKQKQKQPTRTTKNDKLNEEDNKRRQHEMLMKEFKSAHSRMFNKRRTNAAISTESPSEEAVNNRNYSPRIAASSGNSSNVSGAVANSLVMATKSANNNGTKNRSISAVSSVQIATAN